MAKSNHKVIGIPIPDKGEIKSNPAVFFDEMFEELEFTKVRDNDMEIQYDYDKTIMGDKLTHTILFAKISRIIFSYNKNNGDRIGIGIQELQAINKKCEELGWL